MTAEADGTITELQVEELNADGYPEIYVFFNSAGDRSPNGRSLSYYRNYRELIRGSLTWQNHCSRHGWQTRTQRRPVDSRSVRPCAHVASID